MATVEVSPGMRKMMRAMKNMDMKALDLWRPVINQFTAAVQENFDQQGRPKWPPLKEKYGASKHAKYTLTGKRSKRSRGAKAKRHKILQLSGHLRKAATGTKAHGWYQREGKRTLEVGIRGVPYAARHNFGYRGGSGRGRARTPKRTFFVHASGRPAMTPKEVQEMNRTIAAQFADRLTTLKNSQRI